MSYRDLPPALLLFSRCWQCKLSGRLFAILNIFLSGSAAKKTYLERFDLFPDWVGLLLTRKRIAFMKFAVWKVRFQFVYHCALAYVFAIDKCPLIHLISVAKLTTIF